MSEPRDEPRAPGRADDERELEDAGPALRISEGGHPGGPAIDAYLGRTIDIGGPWDEPDVALPRRPRTRGPGGAFASLGAAVLLLVAAISFLASGSERNDATLQALGAALVVIAGCVFGLGLYLYRKG